MSAVIRGYHACQINQTATTTIQTIDFRGHPSGRGGTTGRLRVKNTGSNPVRLYLTGTSAFTTVAASEVFSEPIECEAFRIDTTTGTSTVEILGMCLPTGSAPTT